MPFSGQNARYAYIQPFKYTYHIFVHKTTPSNILEIHQTFVNTLCEKKKPAMQQIQNAYANSDYFTAYLVSFMHTNLAKELTEMCRIGLIYFIHGEFLYYFEKHIRSTFKPYGAVRYTNILEKDKLYTECSTVKCNEKNNTNVSK